KGALAAAAATIGRNSFSVPPEEIEKIKVPTLIVWGEKDRLISPTNATVLHRMITGSEMVMIPKCGHMPQEEKPTVFNKVLLEFLDSKSSR
ncbi:MAG TPA: alpha/beta hydrolase, partial [bacterium]|nr:alpha/beta hydrolase [bacterium]